MSYLGTALLLAHCGEASTTDSASVGATGGSPTASGGGSGSTTGASGGQPSGGSGGRAGTAGSGGAALSCAQARCGGDVVGQWAARSLCTEFPNPLETCRGSTLTVSSTLESNAFDFSPDLRFDIRYAVILDAELIIPGECLPQPLVRTCEDAGRLMTEQDKRPWACTGDVSVLCKCTNQRRQSEERHGRYEISGSQLSLWDEEAPQAQVWDFCQGTQTLQLGQTAAKGQRATWSLEQ